MAGGLHPQLQALPQHTCWPRPGTQQMLVQWLNILYISTFRVLSVAHFRAAALNLCPLLHSAGEENGAHPSRQAHMTFRPWFSWSTPAPKFFGLLLVSRGSRKHSLRLVPVPGVRVGLLVSHSVCLPICSASSWPKCGTRPPPQCLCVCTCARSDHSLPAQWGSGRPGKGSHHTPNRVHLRPSGSQKFFCPPHRWWFLPGSSPCTIPSLLADSLPSLFCLSFYWG